uniref:Defective in cullin neddylation protein n=1 Tax=Panagrellus redivivus TaxID=6233 RepID=A0A7E4VV79_PANRE
MTNWIAKLSKSTKSKSKKSASMNTDAASSSKTDQSQTQSNQKPSKPVSSSKMASKLTVYDQLFVNYANDPSDNLPDRIGPNGVLRLLQDVHAEPTDCSVLIFAWKCKAQTQCEFSNEEWTNGLKAINCDSLDKLQKWFKNARNCIQKPADFDEFYVFSFAYAKSLAQRGLSLEVAVAYWRIIYGDNRRVDHWIKWVEQKGTGITKDEWTSFGAFIQKIKPDFSNYDDTGSWPLRIDDYVEFCKEEKV